MATVTLLITGLSNEGSALRKALPFASVAGSVVTIPSPLPANAMLNDHLVWLWGVLKCERRYLKSLQAEGAVMTVHAKGFRGQLEIRANGAELMHLLPAMLIIDLKEP